MQSVVHAPNDQLLVEEYDPHWFTFNAEELLSYFSVFYHINFPITACHVNAIIDFILTRTLNECRH